MSPAETQQPTPVPDDPTAHLPLLELRDGLSDVIDTESALTEVVDAFRSGTGPVAVDAERASGYRYGQRAYLVQLRREGAGTRADRPDPARPDLSALGDAHRRRRVGAPRRVQDLPCLAEVGMRAAAGCSTPSWPAGCSGYPRVGLGSMVERGARATGWRRGTPPPTGRPARCPTPWLRLRRAGRRGAGRAARRARRRAATAGQAGVGRAGVRRDRATAPPPRAARRPVAAHLRHAPGAQAPRARRRTRAVGGPRPDRRGGGHRPRPGAAGRGDRRGRARAMPADREHAGRR